MPHYTLLEVNDRKTRKEFLMLPVRLYRNDRNWIRPLDEDVERVFDPKENKMFRTGAAIRWLLADPQGKIVGRVAAFYDKATAAKNEQPTGGMGFFECINDREAAFRLFDACKQWLEERGMEAMDGPVNFGERDRWWGLLVDGFTEPNYCMPYNFPYYRSLFEAYGFKNYFNQYTYYRTLTTERGLQKTIREKAERVARNPDYSFTHIDRRNMEKVVDDFRAIYNRAWANFPGVKPISKIHAQSLLKSMQAILDERLMWFGYYRDEPIAFFIMLPEINQIIKRLNGKMNLIGKIKFLLHQKILKTNTKAFGVIFGVAPNHQARGVEGALVMAFAQEAKKPDFHYTDLEMNWIGDFNPSMMRVAEQIGGSIIKTHVTYRYLFDRNKPFTRMKKVNTRN